MYSEDSFFTLTPGGQLGLIVLSTILGGLALVILWHLIRGRNLIMRLTGAAVCFVVFVWITPQAYYFYYLVIFDGLPRQVVIGDLPRPTELLDLLLFRDRQNLSFHARGLLGWTMLLLAVFQPGFHRFWAR